MPRKILFLVLSLALTGSGLIWAQAGPQAPAPGPAGPPPERGLLISAVIPDSPAEKAGLMRGDILLSVDGKNVDTMLDLREILSNARAGQRVTLGIERGGQPRSVALSLEDRLYRPALGLEFAAGRDQFGAAHRGVLVRRIQQGSPAEKAGLQRGDLILAVDGRQATPRNFIGILRDHKPGDTVTLEIARRGAPQRRIEVQLASGPDGNPFLGIQVAPSRFRDRDFYPGRPWQRQG